MVDDFVRGGFYLWVLIGFVSSVYRWLNRRRMHQDAVKGRKV